MSSILKALLRSRLAAPLLLVWASIPPAVTFNGNSFGSTSGKGVYWDHVNPALRQAAVRNPQTVTNLLLRLPELRQRLAEANLGKVVGFYQNDQLPEILTAATNDFGDGLLQ